MNSLSALATFAKTLVKDTHSDIDDIPLPTVWQLVPALPIRKDRELGVEMEREFIPNGQLFADGNHLRLVLRSAFTILKIPADAKRDGSLYEPHAEIVTGANVRRDNVRDIIADIFGAIASSKAVMKDERIRTSTHVHINVGDWTTLEIVTLLSFWGLVDHHIVHAFGGHARSNNSYCTTGEDSFNNFKSILDMFDLRGSRSNLFDAGMFTKYNSLNLATIERFGTIEFRFLPGLPSASDTGDAVCWLYDLVQHVRKTYKSPEEVIAAFSKKGYNIYDMTFLAVPPTSKYLRRVATDLGVLATSSSQAKENVIVLAHSINWKAFYTRQRCDVKDRKYPSVPQQAEHNAVAQAAFNLNHVVAQIRPDNIFDEE